MLMDATGSMSNLMTKATRTVRAMFERTHEVLEDKGITDVSVEMQFAVFRNYNTDADGLLQSSTWESQHVNLHSFMGRALTRPSRSACGMR
eukprot:SAG22_NODE_363_length_11694_cov_40.815783_19_plen_91_part_00